MAQSSKNHFPSLTKSKTILPVQFKWKAGVMAISLQLQLELVMNLSSSPFRVLSWLPATLHFVTAAHSCSKSSCSVVSSQTTNSGHQNWCSGQRKNGILGRILSGLPQNIQSSTQPAGPWLFC